MQCPQSFLVLAGQGFDRARVFSRCRKRSMRLPVGAQNVRQDRGVAGIGFPACLSVPFAVPGDGPRVDRVDGESGVGECDDEQVLVGFDGDRGVLHGAAVRCDQVEQFNESGCTGVDPGAREHCSFGVHDGDVVVDLGPVDPDGQCHVLPLPARRFTSSSRELEVVRRPNGQRSVARHLTSRSRTSNDRQGHRLRSDLGVRSVLSRVVVTFQQLTTSDCAPVGKISVTTCQSSFRVAYGADHPIM
ncbi:hypothetical protein RhoFasB10_01129 [Rhodococcus sp. B10]|nr:hypothetical protein [Rhodococcus sp. B10]